MSKLQGGKFGHGFLSAGVTQALSGGIDRIDSTNQGVSFQRVMVAAMLGGTVSKATGGKFANGAITGAFSRAFNDERRSHRRPAAKFSHYTCADESNCSSSTMTPELTNALSKIMKSDFGSKVSNASGLEFALIGGDSFFAYTVEDNRIFYSLELPKSELAGDGLDSAGMDVLIMHEIGHTPAGSAAYGMKPLKVTQTWEGNTFTTRGARAEEFRTVRDFENPYRADQGLPLRRSYFKENDIPKPLSNR